MYAVFYLNSKLYSAVPKILDISKQIPQKNMIFVDILLEAQSCFCAFP